MLRVISRSTLPRTLIPYLRPICSPFATSSNDADIPSTVSLFGRDPSRPPSLFVVQPRLRPDSTLNSKLSEALNLAKSLEERRGGFFDHDFEAKASPPHLVVQNPASRGLKADTYFGPGTVDNIKCQIRALEEKGDIDAVFVNSVLTGIQQRNLEAAWGKPVLDRVGLIIEIFNAHAETKEAKLQSELAALMYKKSRLVRVRGPGGRLAFGVGGEAEVVSARGRASGGRGFISGAGETELQLQHRRIKERRLYLLSQIEEVRRTRSLQRSARKRHGSSCGDGLATVAFVGYTNAGKSTLVGALSESDLYSDDRLFATVDPRLRSVFLPSGRKILLSDTVGFISDLPVQLVEAFHATLEEVVEADLLVHVLDSSAPNLEEQRESVLRVLEQIGVSEKKVQNMIEVWNKIDLVEQESGDNEVLDDECLTNVEEDSENFQGESEDGELSEIVNSLTLEDSSDELADEDDIASKINGEEDPESFDVESSELSSSETQYADDSVGECSPFEDLEADHLDSNSSIDPLLELIGKKSAAPCRVNVTKYVKTSAVMGVGLQELLHLIDGKLSTAKSCEKSLGPFDKKWRPSYTTDTEKVAQQ